MEKPLTFKTSVNDGILLSLKWFKYPCTHFHVFSALFINEEGRSNSDGPSYFVLMGVLLCVEKYVFLGVLEAFRMYAGRGGSREVSVGGGTN